MSKCENCVHYDVCAELHAYYHKVDKEKVIPFMVDKNSEELNCDHFKDKSLIVELPCRCKDCEFFYNNGVLQLCRYWNGHATTEWNYCSYAKLKEIEG